MTKKILKITKKILNKNLKKKKKKLLESFISLKKTFQVMFEGIKIVSTLGWFIEGFYSKMLDQYKTKQVDRH